MAPFYTTGSRGDLFCLLRTPAATSPRGSVLYLHPFAEEMHKSRRMAAIQAATLAAAGWAVLQVDHTGCGDSAGDFSDGDWPTWCDDAARAWACLARLVPDRPRVLWGLRLGASLAAGMVGELPGVAGLLLWQPVANGDQFLNQFLRIRLASEMLAKGKTQADTQGLRKRLEGGETLEVGGYRLGSTMARDLTGVRLADACPACPVTWLEVGAQAVMDIAPAGRRVVERWSQQGCQVTVQTVVGDPFWITQEITECPNLLLPSLDALDGWASCPHDG